MKRRCYDPKRKAYINYGGRGIFVCDEWKNDVSKFIQWALGNGYQKGLTIDRIDNDKGYSPDNCQFLTLSENSAKKRPNRRRPTKTMSFKKTNLPIGVQKHGSGFRAMASFNNKYKCLGTYRTVDQAKEAYLRAINI
jgi:hypothetical protein